MPGLPGSPAARSASPCATPLGNHPLVSNPAARSPPKVSDSEIRSISEAFKDANKAREAPLTLAGEKYEVIRADAVAIYARNGSSGVIIGRTASNFVLATYAPGMYPAICVEAVEKISEYFRQKGQ